jgi:predicted dehydrogenase
MSERIMSKRIRIGVLGVGSIGKNHARICAGLPNADFTAILDANPDASQSISREYGAPAAGSLEEFAERIDAATVATPTPTHYEMASFLLGHGKHVLVEKPITETPEQAKVLVDLARERGLVLQVGHVERFNPVLSVLEARLTRPRFIEAHRLSPYPFRSLEIGVVLDLMIHDLEIILHLVRSPVQSVDAVGVPVLSKGEDIANARLRFRNGCVANVTASRISPEKMRKFRVFQENAYLSLDYQNQSGEIYQLNDGRIVRESVEVEKDEPLKRELHSFVDCCRRGGEPVVSGSGAAAALELAIDITERIHQGLADLDRAPASTPSSKAFPS